MTDKNTVPHDHDAAEFVDRNTHTPTPIHIHWQDVLVWVLLFALLAGGYALRSVGRNWDDYTHLHPDERFLADVGSRIDADYAGPLSFSEQVKQSVEEQKKHCQEAYPLDEDALSSMSAEEVADAQRSAGKGGYFDARCSPLNPNNQDKGIYVYGEFPMFSLRALAEGYATLTGERHWMEFNGIHLVGRAMNSVFDTLSILLVFLIGLRLFGRWPGLLAAAFYTFAAFPIQQSHFWTVDAFTSFWVLFSIYFAVRVMDDASEYPVRFAMLPWLGLGIGIGLWDFLAADDHQALALVLYPAVFMVAGYIATLAAEADRPYLIALAWLLNVLVLGVGFALGVLALQPVIVALIFSGLLVLLWLGNGYRLFTESGLLVWFGAAFATWVFDSLAHNDTAQLEPLVFYVIFFTLAGIFASVLRRAYRERSYPTALMAAGGVLLFWIVLMAMSGEVSLWGTFTAVLVAAYFIFATFAGIQDYAAFGFAFGAAVAGRVNVVPVVGVLLLAVLIHLLPVINWRDLRWRGSQYIAIYLVGLAMAVILAVGAFAIFGSLIVPLVMLGFIVASAVFLIDWQAPVFYQDALWRALGGLVVAGFAALIAFRILQPHAFLGPNFLNFFPFNPGWQEDIAEAQRLVSPEADFPPAHQWVNRIKWLFPLQNIVLYGLGGALGFTAVGAFIWGLIRTIRGGRDWTRLAIPVAWIAVYFGWLGQNWVSTMRYFMPLYGMLVLLAAWALFELLRFARGKRIMPLASLLTIAVLGYTMLYGYGITNIHRHELTRVTASRYFQEHLPGDFGLWIETDDGQERLVNLGLFANPGNAPDIVSLDSGDTVSLELNPTGTSDLISLEIHLLNDPNKDPGDEVLRFQVFGENDQERVLLGTETLSRDLTSDASVAGEAHLVTFNNARLDPFTYPRLKLDIEVLDGGPVTIASRLTIDGVPFTNAHMTATFQADGGQTLQPQELNLPAETSDVELLYYNPGSRTEYNFTASVSGQITRVQIPHIADPFTDADDETIRVMLVDDVSGTEVHGEVSADFNPVNNGIQNYGPEAVIQLDEPFPVEQGVMYKLVVMPDDLLGVTGTIVANEGAWDDAIPYKVCPLPPGMYYSDDNPSGLCDNRSIGIDPYFGLYNGLELQMASEDDASKRDRIFNRLNQADYLTISSNRFYDSAARVPTRWPMTNRYYEALFNEELGFELVEVFTSYARVGPIVWKDQVLPSDDLPDWMNEFEAEEAFHVYDHPTVFLFRKTEDYSPDKLMAVLDGNLRRFSDVVGTDNLVDPEPASILTWPIEEATQSPTALQFTEETEAIQKAGGTWSDMFSREFILNRYQVLGVIAWWLMLVVIGLITFPLFFWMFPALPDRGYGMAKMFGWIVVAWAAWFAGSFHIKLWTQGGLWLIIAALALFSGTIAYRYRYGFMRFLREKANHLLIIEGVSLLLFLLMLGVRAGNPDLWHQSFGGEKPMDFAYLNGVLHSSVFPPIDPWFAGGYINYYYWGFVLVGAPIKALGIMPSFAYNLILPTLFMWLGIGGFTIGYNLVEWRNRRQVFEDVLPARRPPFANAYLAGALVTLMMVLLGNLDTPRTFARPVWRSGLSEQFFEENDRFPTNEELDEIEQNASLGDILSGFGEGIGEVLDGEPLPIAPHRWYWGPRSVLTELPDGKGHNAIAEMPYFTFLYGDLHAHMISMPLSLFVILFVIAEILGGGLMLRSGWAAFASIASGALVAGILRATNTWDWPVYLIVGIAGLTFARWVAQQRRSTGIPEYPFFTRLRMMLDLRYVHMLWPVLIGIPLAMLLAGGLHEVHEFSYETKLENNQIPTFCQDYDKRLDDPDIDPSTLREPNDCEGKLKPRLDAMGLAKFGAVGLAGGIGLYVVGFVLLGQHFNRRSLLRWLFSLAGFVIVNLIVALPFALNYAVPYSSLLPWEQDKTPLWVYLTIHGLFLFVMACFVLWQLFRWLRNHQVSDLRGMGVPLVVGVIVILATPFITYYFSDDYPAFLVTIPLLVGFSLLFLLPDQSNTERLVYAAAALGLGLTMGVELIVLEGDNGRQNTLFKYYIQAWLLFSISSGVALAWMLAALGRWPFIIRTAFQTGLTILMAVAAMFPLMATQGRFMDRMNGDDTPLTLDGMAYMRYAPHNEEGVAFNLRGDYEIIKWLQENTEGTPYIMEGFLAQYRWGGRINIYTGLPAVLGWNYHQRQQRAISNLNNMVWNRQHNVDAFYTTADIEAAWEILQFYDVDYIVVGTLERIIYGDVVVSDSSVQTDIAPGILKFERMVELGLLEEVFRNDVCVSSTVFDVDKCPKDRRATDKIYRVVDGAEYNPIDVAVSTE